MSATLRLEQLAPATVHPEKDWVLTDGIDLLLAPMSAPSKTCFLAESVGGDMAIQLFQQADLTALVQEEQILSRRGVNEQGLCELNEAVERARSSADHVGALYVTIGAMALADGVSGLGMEHTWRIAPLYSVQIVADRYAPIIQGQDGALGLIPRRVAQEVQLRHNMPKF